MLLLSDTLEVVVYIKKGTVVHKKEILTTPFAPPGPE